MLSCYNANKPMEVKPESTESKDQSAAQGSVASPVMNVVAPPPPAADDKTSGQPPVIPPPLTATPPPVAAVVSSSVQAEVEKDKKKLLKTPQPAKAGGIKKNGDSVMTAIVATVVIVLGLAALAVYAYTKTK
jgi:hypothetical protein